MTRPSMTPASPSPLAGGNFVMPILGSRAGQKPALVSFYATDKIRRQAMANHYQTLERLRERGGLSWAELAAVLEERKWKALPADVAQERVLAKAKLERAA